MTTQIEATRLFNRQMLRSAFQSLFWHVLITRKRETGFTLKVLADKLGINKSYVSRSFSSPPNWQIDKISDIAEAMGVDLIIQAKDRKSGKIYTASGSSVNTAETRSGMCDILYITGENPATVGSAPAFSQMTT
jgi:DNA-binding phage protein